MGCPDNRSTGGPSRPMRRSTTEHLSEMQSRVETLEGAAADLVAFRDQATTRYNQLILRRGPLKRPKATSGAEGISPDTNSARPPSKKLSRWRINFSSSVQCKLIHYKHAINDTTVKITIHCLQQQHSNNSHEWYCVHCFIWRFLHLPSS